jgi:hypothetical protein
MCSILFSNWYDYLSVSHECLMSGSFFLCCTLQGLQTAISCKGTKNKEIRVRTLRLCVNFHILLSNAKTRLKNINITLNFHQLLQMEFGRK